LACLKTKTAAVPKGGGYNPSVVIQGKIFTGMRPIQPEMIDHLQSIYSCTYLTLTELRMNKNYSSTT